MAEFNKELAELAEVTNDSKAKKDDKVSYKLLQNYKFWCLF